jgi:hypothetical protein
MRLRRGHSWGIVGGFAVLLALVAVAIIAFGGAGSQTTGPGGKALFTRIGFATNCSYVATVRLEPGGPAFAQYGTRGPVPRPTASPTGPRHHPRTSCLSAHYDPGVFYSAILVMNGRQVPPAGAIFTYYVLGGNAPAGSQVSIPPGMRMIATSSYFTCAHEHTPAAPQPFDCSQSQPDEPRVALWANFPTCWDGRGTQPNDAAYPVDGDCPTGFPKRFPLIQVQMTWRIADGTGATFTTGDTFQVSFENFWLQRALDTLVENCIDVQQRCGAIINYFHRTPLPP